MSTTMSTVATHAGVRVRPPLFLGGAQQLLAAVDAEVCMDGPAGTGKSFAALWKVHLRRVLFPGSRGLLARKTLVSLKASTLETWRKAVLGELLAQGYVRYWAQKGDEPAHYAYWNGSVEAIGGLDAPGKVMSTEWDDILVDEALETEEADVEALLSRTNRPGHVYGTPGRPPYAQLILVTNPGAPTHWLNQRMLTGRTRRILSRHGDNPAMTDAYLRMLAENLTGVRRKRLYLGQWAQAEGTVYEDAWLPERNLVDRRRFSSRPGDLTGDCGLPSEWGRYLGIDWGYRAPLSVQWWARRPDGELVLYREVYTTMRLVEDVAREALGVMGWRMTDSGALVPNRANPDPLPREIIADHDAEDRATWERHFGLAVFPARKGRDSISDGIQAVTKRLHEGRLLVLRDSLVRRDPLLDEKKQPQGLAEEMDAYVWDVRAGRAAKEVPLDEHNHAQDAARYVVTYFDRQEESDGAIAFHAVGY